MGDWTAFVGIAALAVSLFAILSRALDKSLSIREHEEFRGNMKDQFSLIREQAKRDGDRIEKRLDVLEQTRPTTGELEARLQATKVTKNVE